MKECLIGAEIFILKQFRHLNLKKCCQKSRKRSDFYAKSQKKEDFWEKTKKNVKIVVA
jgi:hypothetical protein